MLKKILLSFMLLSVFILCGCEKQEEQTDKLAEIKARGHLIVGVKYDTKPFGFVDGDNVLKGYDVDLARALAGKIFGNDGYYELTDKVYLRQDYLKYDNGIYYFWLKRLPGAFGIKEENKNISYISELIAVDIINQKFADVEMYVYDKNNHIIDQMVSKQGKVEFETIAPDTIAQSFLFFVRQLDSEIPNRYKKRLKGYFN